MLTDRETQPGLKTLYFPTNLYFGLKTRNRLKFVFVSKFKESNYISKCGALLILMGLYMRLDFQLIVGYYTAAMMTQLCKLYVPLKKSPGYFWCAF